MTEHLKQLIHDSGLSLLALGREAGIAQPILWRFMAGERDLTLRTVEKLVNYFDLELKPRGRGKRTGRDERTE
jgi:hypothetical protein